METTIYVFGIFFAYFVRRKLFFFSFRRNFFDGDVKAAYYLSKEWFWGRLLFLECTEAFMDIEAKFSRPLSRHIRLGCQILIIRVHRNFLRFFSEIFYFLILSVLGQNVFGCSSQFFCQGCQNGVLSVLRKILRIFIPKICFFRILRAYRNNLRIFSGKFLVLIYFWTWAKNLGRKSFDGNVKRAFEVCKESIWGKILFAAFFYFFSTLNKKFPGLRWEFSGNFVETTFYVFGNFFARFFVR